MTSTIRDLTGKLGGGHILMRFNGLQAKGLSKAHDLRLRNNEGAKWLYEHLTDIEAEPIGDLYEPNDGLALSPLRDDLGFGIKKVKMYLSSGGGRAGIVEGVDPEIARVSKGLRPLEDDVITFALGFEVDSDELMAADAASEIWNYVREHDLACENGLMERIDQVIMEGSSTAGLRGMFQGKASGIGTYKLRGAGGGETLKPKGAVIDITSTISADDLANTLMWVLDQVYEATKKTIRPNRLALPLRVRNLASRLRLGDTGQSVLSYVAENSPYLASVEDVVGVSGLENFMAAKGGEGPFDAIVPYRHDLGVVCTRIMSARRHSVQQFTFGELVVWAARMHPTLWKRPMGCIIFQSKWA